MNIKLDTDFEIIASTTADILVWIDEQNLRFDFSSEHAQIEVGKRVKSAVDRAHALHQTSLRRVAR